MIGRGGDAHIRWYQRQTQMRELGCARAVGSRLEQFGRLGEWMERALPARDERVVAAARCASSAGRRPAPCRLE